MATERLATQRGREIPNAVTVLVGGKSYDGWTDVSISKSLESIANSFSISLFDKFEGLQQDWPLKPGVSIKVNIGSERVITGRIEKLDVNYTDENRGFTISGRSNPGDLVDCMHLSPYEYKNITLTKLAEEMVKPFGLRVFESVVPKTIDKFAIKPGESVFSALDRAAREQGFFFISTRGGNIRLTRAARARAFSSLQQDINILSAVASFDDSKRHDRYIVKGQTFGLDNFFGESVTKPEGEATDAGVTRHRPFVMVSESGVDSAKAKTRAEWEASVRLAHALRVEATVRDWVQGDGSLWGINQLTTFTSSFLGLNRDLLITNVVHNDGAKKGKTTTLTLVPPESYNPEPVKNKKEDIFASLGAGFTK